MSDRMSRESEPDRFEGKVSVLGHWRRCDAGCRSDGSTPMGPCHRCKGRGEVRVTRRVWMRNHRIQAPGGFDLDCPDRRQPDLERRPVNGLNVEIGTPLARCMRQSPDGRGAVWVLSGGSILAYGVCCRASCPLEK